MIYVIASPKGGVGKSTLAINLAAYLSKWYGGEKPILLIDADRQQSTQQWAYWREDESVAPAIKCIKMADNENIEELIPHYANSYEDVIIDVGGYESGIFMRALMHADKIFIPSTTATFDFASTLKMVQLLDTKIHAVNPAISYQVIFWRIQPRESEDKKCVEYQREISEQAGRDIRTAPVIVHDRLAFRESLIEGRSVFDYPENARYKKSQEELNALFLDIVHSYIL